MTVKVELADLAAALDGMPDTCFLLTTNEDYSPHPANVRMLFADGQFTVSAGRRSCRNGGDRPTVTLMWPAQTSEAMTLLVDGVATVLSGGEGKVVVQPTSAIWHAQPS